MTITLADILAQDTHYRRAFVNTLPGPRTAHLIGTRGHRGTENLGVFNTIVHLQASPPLLGFILRPLTVPRETFHNILASKHYTINTIGPDWLDAAHQTSANYPVGESEFAATGLTPYYEDGFKAPFVAESPVRLGLEYVEHHALTGGTTLVIGRLLHAHLVDSAAVGPGGHIDHEKLQTTVVAGLDRYFQLKNTEAKAYARPKS